MKIDFTIGFYMELSLGGALEVKKKATQQFSPELATSWTGLKIIDLNQFVDYKSNFVEMPSFEKFFDKFQMTYSIMF